MKKQWFCSFFSLYFFLFILLMSACANVGGNSADDAALQTPSYTIDMPYVYPMEFGSEEWFAIQYTPARWAVFDVPEEFISKMTTEALLYTAMDNPYFMSALTWDSGTVSATTSLSGMLPELLNREDFETVYKKVKNDIEQRAREGELEIAERYDAQIERIGLYLYDLPFAKPVPNPNSE